MTSRSHILQACFSFLVPVARLLLRSGISYREFAEISRLAFVEVASRDYGIRGRETNMSRVSAMTGIGRKEVRRLRQLKRRYDEDLQDHLRTQFNPLGDVLHYWFTDGRFLDEQGKPRPLPMKGENSFEELVKHCAGDLPSGAVKVELIRCGAIEEDERGLLRARRRAIIPAAVHDKVIHALGVRLRALALTAVHNCTEGKDGEAWLEREVYSTRIPAKWVEKLRPVIKTHVSRCISELDDMMSEVEVPDGGPFNRIGVGFFYYEDEPD